MGDLGKQKNLKDNATNNKVTKSEKCFGIGCLMAPVFLVISIGLMVIADKCDVSLQTGKVLAWISFPMFLYALGWFVYLLRGLSPNA